ncbi:MAG: aminotransferase class I/II-fold pyridoxal phosphate-dependent enzyme, partial [Chloroflexota bacterium]
LYSPISMIVGIAGSYVSRDLPEGLEARPTPAPAPCPAHIPNMAQLGTAPFNTGRTAWDERTARIWRQLTLRRLQTPDPAMLGYGDPQGARPLREAIAAYLGAARAVRCTAGQVVVTSGAQQAIGLVLRVLLSPGDAAWIEDPAYPALRAANLHPMEALRSE